MPVVTSEELFKNWKMRLLLFGGSGVGKTRLAGSAALVKELCPIYWFAPERGMLSVKPMIETGRIRVMLAVAGSDLLALQKIIAHPGRFKTVVIDSLSELHALIIRDAQQRSNSQGKVPSRSQYREAHDKVLQLLRYIDRNASVHIIATANDQYLVETESQRILAIDPDMAGKLSYRVTRYFDGVYHLGSRSEPSIVPDKPMQVVRWMQVQNYDGVSAKDRSPEGALGNVLMEPTMAKIYTALIGPCTILPGTRVDDPEIIVDGQTASQTDDQTEGREESETETENELEI